MIVVYGDGNKINPRIHLCQGVSQHGQIMLKEKRVKTLSWNETQINKTKYSKMWSHVPETTSFENIKRRVMRKMTEKANAIMRVGNENDSVIIFFV